MRRNKTSIGSLILAGAAAYGLYKLSKMNSSQRNDLISKGKQFINENLGNITGKLGGTNSKIPVNTGNGYTEHSYS